MAHVKTDPRLYFYHGEGGDVVVPDGMIAIGYEGFLHSDVTSVVIPKSVKTIGTHAFSDCRKLKRVRIEGSEVDIQRNAFLGCNALCELDLPDDFKDPSAFGLLERFAYLKYNSYYKERDIVNWILDGMPKYAPVKKLMTYVKNYSFKVLKYLVKEGTVESFLKVMETGVLGEFDPDAFEEISRLTDSVEFRAAILSHKNRSFTQEELEKFEEEKLAKAIGEKEYEVADFVRTYLVRRIEGGYEVGEYMRNNDREFIPDRLSGAPVLSIGARAFVNRHFLKQVILPPTIQKIGDFAFDGCNGLTVLEIPSSVISIGTAAFRGCEGLSEVSIGKGVKKIEPKAFFNCANLVTVKYEGSFAEWLKVKDEGSMLFANANEAFFQGEKLPADLVVPEGVKEIPKNAFCGYGGFTSITLPECVHKICSGAFKGCRGLTTITMSASVRRIEEDALTHCDDLKRINFLGTRKRWSQVAKFSDWARRGPERKVHCLDDND